MTKARIVILLALTMGLILLLTPIGQAQTFRGRIQGIVTDESKAVVINATVTALNVNTGIKVVRQTSDTGLFLFDNVEPGTYSISVENVGFNKFLQENVLVQAGGDVTVNAVLKPGSVQTTVTVNEAPPAVEFNSSNRESTLDQKMAEETPRLDRNSFKLGLLVPSAVNTRGENQPYNSWGPNSVDLGGGTNLQNELEVDGSPIGLGHKASVIPNVDAVQEVVVSTNSTNAESGHSAGGAILVTTKSGTNEWHGSGFYLGRYPWASAESDRTTFSANAERRNMYGGTLGNPILKNKLFNFFSMEYWKITDPNVWLETLPTTLEKQGDFTQSHYLSGGVSGIRTIYDPYTMVTSPSGTSASATPFAGNVIPAARFDPITAGLVSQFWAPNNPGIDITGTNNFDKGYTETFNYYDYSDRADYNISDKWKVFGRVARYHTTDSSGNPTGTNTEFYVPTGTLRTGWQASGDAIWTINPRTVMSFHGDWRNVIDAYVSTPLSTPNWSSIWPNNPWYTSYQNPQTNNQPVYFPALYVNGNLFGGHGFYWNQRPAGQAYNAKISHQVGSHFLKAGFEMRASYGLVYVNSAPGFNFDTALTANTYINPNTNVFGDAYATYLLGALGGDSTMYGGPAPDPHTEFYGVYFQDDWKLSRRITLNLGIRDDYETAWHDPPHELATGLDLSVANPAITGNPPVMPAAATVHRGRQQLLLVERPMEFHQLVPSRHVESAEACAPAPRRPGVQDRRQDGSPVRLRPVLCPHGIRIRAGSAELGRGRPGLPGTAVLWHVGQSEHAVSHCKVSPKRPSRTRIPAGHQPAQPDSRKKFRAAARRGRIVSGLVSAEFAESPTTTGSTSRSSTNCRARSSSRERISSISGDTPTRRS
jgi:hypothetical protein